MTKYAFGFVVNEYIFENTKILCTILSININIYEKWDKKKTRKPIFVIKIDYIYQPQ